MPTPRWNDRSWKSTDPDADAAELAAELERLGELVELDAIFAVVVGGTALTGGKFSLAGSLAGSAKGAVSPGCAIPPPCWEPRPAGRCSTPRAEAPRPGRAG